MILENIFPPFYPVERLRKVEAQNAEIMAYQITLKNQIYRISSVKLQNLKTLGEKNLMKSASTEHIVDAYKTQQDAVADAAITTMQAWDTNAEVAAFFAVSGNRERLSAFLRRTYNIKNRNSKKLATEGLKMLFTHRYLVAYMWGGEKTK